jgi:hypothetical protein
MCQYMYMCICIEVHICFYIYIYIYIIFIFTYIYLFIRACTHAYMYVMNVCKYIEYASIQMRINLLLWNYIVGGRVKYVCLCSTNHSIWSDRMIGRTQAYILDSAIKNIRIRTSRSLDFLPPPPLPLSSPAI